MLGVVFGKQLARPWTLHGERLVEQCGVNGISGFKALLIRGVLEQNIVVSLLKPSPLCPSLYNFDLIPSSLNLTSFSALVVGFHSSNWSNNSRASF